MFREIVAMLRSSLSSRFLPSHAFSSIGLLLIVCLVCSVVAEASIDTRLRHAKATISDEVISVAKIQRSSLSQCNVLKPSVGSDWTCVDGDWYHEGDILIEGDWVLPKTDRTSDVSFGTYKVHGSVTIGGSLVFKGEVFATIEATGCVSIGDEVLFDWVDDGIPVRYSNTNKTYTWKAIAQNSANTTSCPESLVDVAIIVWQGGCKNADMKAVESHDSLGVVFSVGQNFCLLHGLLFVMIVVMPIPVGGVLLLAYIIHKCTLRRPEPNMFLSKSYNEINV